MKRPEVAVRYFCPACGREWIEVGPWAFGAICKHPSEHASEIREFGGYLGGGRHPSVMRDMPKGDSDAA